MKRTAWNGQRNVEKINLIMALYPLKSMARNILNFLELIKFPMKYIKAKYQSVLMYFTPVTTLHALTHCICSLEQGGITTKIARRKGAMHEVKRMAGTNSPPKR